MSNVGVDVAPVLDFGARLKEKCREQKIVASIKTIQASGIDGILPLGELVKLARNPAHVVSEDGAAVLKQYGLLEKDGSMNDAVRRAVLSHTSSGNFF